jgi:nondiscriminating glutamyl-tRNA synthetase
MSKRAGEAAVAVADWRRAGYVADAMVNYLALLGFHPGDDREILSRDELLAAFSLERVGSSGSIFDADKLRWTNAHYLHHADGPRLLAWAEPFLPEAARELPRPELEQLVTLVRGNVSTLAELPGELAPFLGDAYVVEEGAEAALAADGAAAVCAAGADAFAALAEWNPDGIKSAIQSAGRALGVKGRELFQPLRAALTGRTHGPELPAVAFALGRERCVSRLRRVPGEVRT